MSRSEERRHIAWFDELFEGGLRIPTRESRTAMTLVVNGPPGTGKTTLCLELCYRLASNQSSGQPLRSLYLTTEGYAPWLIGHAREFGWDQQQTILGVTAGSPVYVRALKTEQDFSRLKLELQPRRKAMTGQAPPDNPASFSKFIDQIHLAYFGKSTGLPLHHDEHALPAHHDGLQLSNFDVLVFDNLNTMPSVDKGPWFQMLTDLGQLGPRLVIVVLDSTSTNRDAELWDYIADVVIRLNRENRETGGYLIRTIEILKSRYQISALGRHQVKIHKAHSLKVNDGDGWLRMRQHPFREEGGIFIYPSMHFVLSRHKYLHPKVSKKEIEPIFPEFGELLSGGFHPGRCIAFVGGGGTHKSRLAYAQLLWTLYQEPKARAIIISLGDDEVATANNLADIAAEQKQLKEEFAKPNQTVKDLTDAGRLEIAYYPPGFITPEEFFHRLQLSIGRHRDIARQHDDEEHRLIVVFNSLNLLHSHFPLCAEHKVFIPAVVELLSHEGVTSLFVSRTNASEDEYGLLSLADPIFDFQRAGVAKQEVFDHILPDEQEPTNRKSWPDVVNLVRVEVARFAGGTSAGEHGFLALASEGDALSSVVGQGLHFWLPR